MYKKTSITYAQIKQALFDLPSGEMFTMTELREYIDKYYYRLHFVDILPIEEICNRLTKNSNFWDYFNAITVNGIVYYWFDKKAYQHMKEQIAKRTQMNQICKRVYSLA